MATYYNRRLPTDTKYVVHPHYANELDASNEAIGHQVRHKLFRRKNQKQNPHFAVMCCDGLKCVCVSVCCRAEQ